jgi:hypothetical protein
MKKIAIFVIFIFLLLWIVPAFGASDPVLTPTQKGMKFGVSLALAVVPFEPAGGGDSGPETPLSTTKYKDTFDMGWGGRVEGFYDWTPTLRGQVGIVHNRWKGKHFTGGEFPNGADFGDFNLTALYIGLKYRFLPASRLRPYILGNIGVASLSSVDVTFNGSTRSYWSQTYRDYLDIGTGVEYRLTDHIGVYLDVRLEVFGKPNSDLGYIADATGGHSLPVTIGLDFSF